MDLVWFGEWVADYIYRLPANAIELEDQKIIVQPQKSKLFEHSKRQAPIELQVPGLHGKDLDDKLGQIFMSYYLLLLK